MAKQKHWVVTASAKRPLRAIAKDLRDAGLQDVRVLKEVGVVTGKASDTVVPKLRKVAGVADVAADVPVDVGPPGSDKTW